MYTSTLVNRCVSCNQIIPDGDNNHKCSARHEASILGASRRHHDNKRAEPTFHSKMLFVAQMYHVDCQR